MFAIDHLILLLGVLVVVATLSSRVSARLGLPLLISFVAIGMLAGSEGFLGIEFEDFRVAHAVGTLALILILFDGGMHTTMDAVRRTARPAGVLATVGVFVTAGSMGLAAWYLLDLPLAYGLLFGSIVGSTDAAAVFSALRATGLNLRPRLAAIIEIESGSNDPMAVLLTIACIEYLRGDLSGWVQLAGFLAVQILVGALVGWGVGRLIGLVLQKVRLAAAGLYPMLTLGGACLAFGLAAVLEGSGFLAVYLAGIAIGHRRVPMRHDLSRFHDGVAWLSQIGMFVVLGLLASPSGVERAWPQGLLLTALLLFVARPLAVAVSLKPLRFSWQEIAFIAWAGLRGAVPIVLAIYPLMFGIEHANMLFQLVFFVVLASVTVQGWTLRPLARALGVAVPAPPPAPLSVEVTSLQNVDAEIVDYVVASGARAAHCRLDELGLPADMAVALVAREGEMIVPHGDTELRPGDHAFVTLRPRLRWLVDHVFSPGESPVLAQPVGGDLTLAELHADHGLPLPGDRGRTLAQFLAERLDRAPERGDAITVGMLRFTVLDLAADGTASDVRVDLA